MPTPSIFVSHSHHDSAFTQQLVADLRAAFPEEDAVWMDEFGGLHGGDAWVDKLVAEITARGIFIVVLSPEALPPHSRWVPFEMGIALRQHVEEGKRLLPVLLRPCAIPEAWKGTQYVDCTGYPETYANKLREIVQFVQGVVSTEGERHPTLSRASPATPLVQDANTAAGRELWEEVVDKTDLLIGHYPQAMTVDLWRRRGRAYLGLGNAGDALRALEHALDPQTGIPLDAATLRLKGQAQGLLGQVDAAVETLRIARKSARLDETTLKLEILTEQYDLLRQGSRWPEVEALCADALKLAPQDATWQHRQLAARLAPIQARFDHAMQAHEYPQALTACADALRVDALNGSWRERQRQASTAQQAAIDAAQARAREDAARQAQAAQEQQRRRDAEQQFVAPLLTQLQRDNRKFTSAILLYDGQPHAVILPPVCPVEAGPFWMGTKGNTGDEPWHEVTTGAYAIGKYPVTVAEYACAVRAGKVAEPPTNRISWADQLKRLDHPVVNVTWKEAQKYVEWLAEVTGEPWRFPTEAEWEKAARGTDGRIYPWGNQWDPNKANTDSRVKATTSVGAYAAKGDASPYGCHDMAGNVWEWTSSIYDVSAYQPDNKRENSSDKTSVRVLRGGSWSNNTRDARAAGRYRYLVDVYLSNCGFRLVRGVGAGSH